MPQFVTFHVDGQSMCMDIACVREINRVRELTPAALAPHYVLGLMNLRGHVVTMLSLGRRLGLAGAAKSQAETCIILKSMPELARNGQFEEDAAFHAGEDVIGLVVDGVGDVIDVPADGLGPSPANIPPAQSAYLRGVARNGSKVYPIVHIGMVLRTDAELAV